MSEFKLQLTTEAKNAGLYIKKRKKKGKKKGKEGEKFRVGPEIVQGEGDKDLETIPYRNIFVYLNHFFAS